MLPQNIKRLEKYRSKYETLLKDNTLHMTPEERAEVIDVIRQDFLPGYTVMEWCGHCVADMLKLAFREMDVKIKTKKK